MAGECIGGRDGVGVLLDLPELGTRDLEVAALIAVEVRALCTTP